MSRLFVYGVNQRCPEDTIKSEFEKCGEVTDVFITGKGYAFVTMADEEGASNAIRDLNGVTIDGQEIKVDNAKKREDHGGGGSGGDDGGFRRGGFRGGSGRGGGGGGGFRDGGGGGYRGGRGGGRGGGRDGGARDGGGGGRDHRGRGCYNCGEDGHMAKECPNKGASYRDGGGRSGF